jgi:hypothetical protein
MRGLLLSSVLALLLAGCAAGGGGGQGATGAAARAAEGDTGAGEAPPAGRRYEADATVLENADHGPQLCLGGVLDSLPPQCAGLPITNWDWERAGGAERRAGVTWGFYHVVGTYDGTSFTVADVGPPKPAAPTRDQPFPPACPEPPGGWARPDPARAGDEDMQAAISAARARPDFAGAWIAYLEPMGGNTAEDPGEFVLNLAFTGDLARHEREARERWGGRLCVARKDRAFRELARIQGELSGAVGRELGLQVLTSGLDEYGNAVTLGIVAGAERAQAALDRRYGPGVVRVEAALAPVG